MREQFEIEWTGTTSQERVSVESLSIQLGVLTLRNTGTDEWPLTIPCGLNDAVVIPPRAVVVVWRWVVDEWVRYFTGEAGETARDWTPDLGCVQIVTLSGAWHQLTKSVYERGDLDEFLYPTGMPIPPRASYSWDFLKDYMDSYLSSWVQWPSFADTGLTEVWEMVVFGLTQTSLSANVQALLSSYPRSGLYFDYTTEIPTAIVSKYLDNVVSIARDDLKSIGKLRRNDNVPDAIVLRKNFPWSSYDAFPEPVDIPYWVQQQCSTGFEKTLAQYVYPVGQPIAGPNVVPLTHYWLQYDNIPAGGAEFIFDTLSLRYYSGSIVVRGASDVKPGFTLNLTDTPYSAANLVAQSVAIDFSTDETTIEVGVHPMVASSRALDRLRAWLASRFSWAQQKFPPTLTDPELP